MAQQALLDAIDREIAKLQQVRNMLEGEDANSPAPALRGSETKPATKRPGPAKGTKRKLSEEARARIAAAQKKRWARKNAPEEAAAD